MNFKYIVLIRTLVVAIGLFGVESANARNVLAEAPVATPSTNIAPSSPVTIAQVSDLVTPIYGSWRLRHSVGGIVHESVLVMTGYSGRMRTRYYDPNLRKTQTVDQTMYLKPSPGGLVIWGYNPVYSGTSRKHPTYLADNFLFSIPPEGPAVFVNCDDGNQCSPVDVERIQ